MSLNKVNASSSPSRQTPTPPSKTHKHTTYRALFRLGNGCGICETEEINDPTEFCQIYADGSICTEQEIWEATHTYFPDCTKTVIHRSLRNMSVHLVTADKSFREFTLDYQLHACKGPGNRPTSLLGTGPAVSNKKSALNPLQDICPVVVDPQHSMVKTSPSPGESTASVTGYADEAVTTVHTYTNEAKATVHTHTNEDMKSVDTYTEEANASVHTNSNEDTASTSKPSSSDVRCLTLQKDDVAASKNTNITRSKTQATPSQRHHDNAGRTLPYSSHDYDYRKNAKVIVGDYPTSFTTTISTLL